MTKRDGIRKGNCVQMRADYRRSLTFGTFEIGVVQKVQGGKVNIVFPGRGKAFTEGRPGHVYGKQLWKKVSCPRWFAVK